MKRISKRESRKMKYLSNNKKLLPKNCFYKIYAFVTYAPKPVLNNRLFALKLNFRYFPWPKNASEQTTRNFICQFLHNNHVSSLTSF